VSWCQFRSCRRSPPPSLRLRRANSHTWSPTPGRPWVKESFGNWFRDACRKASCPGSAHGLRKAGATRAAERGASERQLMAIFGWSTAKMAAHYTRSADRKRLAHDAAQLLLPAQEKNEKRRHLGSGAGENANSRKGSGALKMTGAQERTRTSTPRGAST